MKDKIRKTFFILLAVLVATMLIWLTISLINLLTGHGFTWTRDDFKNNQTQQNQEDFDYDYQLGGGNPLND